MTNEREIRAVQEIWAYHVYLELPAVQKVYTNGEARCAIGCLFSEEEVRYIDDNTLEYAGVKVLLDPELPHREHLPSLYGLHEQLLYKIQRNFDLYDLTYFPDRLAELCHAWDIPYPGGE